MFEFHPLAREWAERLAGWRCHAHFRVARSFAALRDGALCGQLALGERESEVYAALAPEWRGRGVGLAYLREALKFAAGLGFARPRARLRPGDVPALRCLLRLGFDLEPIELIEPIKPTDERAALRAEGDELVLRRAPAHIDITTPLREGMAVYPGDPAFALRPHATLEADGARVSALSMCAHTGTHVDAPAHYLAGGATVDTLPADALCGPAYVTSPEAIDRAPVYARRLLLRGEGVSVPQARALAARPLALVGTEGLSVAPRDAESEVHTLLLGAGILVLEALDLSGARDGWYALTCLPLRIAGCEAAPARAMLSPLPGGEDL